jgi:hypothetical protein
MAEAPGVEQFVRQNSKVIDVIGLGSQDNLKQARSFITRTKVKSFPMYWDKTGQSWTKLGVPTQPAWFLIASDGTVLDAQLGSIPYAKVLKAIA